MSWFLSLMLDTPWERCDPHHRYNRHKYNCHSSSLVTIIILIISNIIIVILNSSIIDRQQIISGWNCKGACRLHWQIQMNVLINQQKQNYMWRSIQNYKMNSGYHLCFVLSPTILSHPRSPQPLQMHMSHCQMLGKFEYTLPAKFWRLVGCTEMLSW